MEEDVPQMRLLPIRANHVRGGAAQQKTETPRMPTSTIS